MDKNAIEGEDAEKARDLFNEFVIRFQENFDNEVNEIEKSIDEIRSNVIQTGTEMGYEDRIKDKVWYEVVAPWLEELIKAFIY